MKKFSALDARIWASVEKPSNANRNDREGNQHVESGRDEFKVGISPAKNFRDKERAISGNCGSKARHQRRMERIIKDVGNHTEGRAVDKTSREEEEQKRREEHNKAMRLQAEQNDDNRGEH